MPVGIAHLGHDHDLIPRKVEFLDCLAENDLRQAIRVNISGIEGLNPSIVTINNRLSVCETGHIEKVLTLP